MASSKLFIKSHGKSCISDDHSSFDEGGCLTGDRILPATANKNQSGLASFRLTIGQPSKQFLHEFDELVVHMDIPQYLTDNKNLLRFPEKVSKQSASLLKMQFRYLNFDICSFFCCWSKLNGLSCELAEA
jgi:hypothetical protein